MYYLPRPFFSFSSVSFLFFANFLVCFFFVTPPALLFMELFFFFLRLKLTQTNKNAERFPNVRFLSRYSKRGKTKNQEKSSKTREENANARNKKTKPTHTTNYINIHKCIIMSRRYQTSHVVYYATRKTSSPSQPEIDRTHHEIRQERHLSRHTLIKIIPRTPFLLLLLPPPGGQLKKPRTHVNSIRITRTGATPPFLRQQRRPDVSLCSCSIFFF